MRSTVLLFLLFGSLLGSCTNVFQRDEARELARLHFKTMSVAYKNYDRVLLKKLMDFKSSSIHFTLLRDPELLGRIGVRSADFVGGVDYDGDIYGYAGNGLWEPVNLKFELKRSSPTRFVLTNLTRCDIFKC